MTSSQGHEFRFAPLPVANNVAPRQSASETFAGRQPRQLEDVAAMPLIFRFKNHVVSPCAATMTASQALVVKENHP